MILRSTVTIRVLQISAFFISFFSRPIESRTLDKKTPGGFPESASLVMDAAAAPAPAQTKPAKKGFDATSVGVFSYPGSHHVNTDYGLGPNAIGTWCGTHPGVPILLSIRPRLSDIPNPHRQIANSDLPSRWNGMQMTHGIPPPHPLQGTAIDIEVRRLGENDPYVDSGKHDRAAAHAAERKRVSQKGFFPPKGSFGELLGPRYENINEGDEKDLVVAAGGDSELSAAEAASARKKALKKLPKRGVYTAPGKKGSSNTPGVTIGKGLQSFPETYQPGRELSKIANRKARARIEIPWGAGCAGNGVGRDFDTALQNVTYEPGAWVDKQRVRRNTTVVDGPKPFKPGGSKMAPAQTWAYQSDPHDYEAERRLKAVEDAKKAGKFKPPAGAKTTAQSPISKYDKGTWAAPSSLRETQLIK